MYAVMGQEASVRCNDGSVKDRKDNIVRLNNHWNSKQ